MKVLYTGVRKEHYSDERGYSFEYNNFYLTLAHMDGMEVVEHPFDLILTAGKERFNAKLLELVKEHKPDLVFAFMYTDELDPAVLQEIRSSTKTRTVAWFADDYWRFWNYSKHWPPHFDLLVTTYSKAVEWYNHAGFTNILLSQWACNTAVYKPLSFKKDIDVGFVGQYKPGRARVLARLLRAGIAVEAFGYGWPNGKTSQDEMLRVFARSKININLTARQYIWSPSVLGRLVLKKSVNRLVPDFHLIDNLRAVLHFPTLHTHARPFELAGCRAFVISGRSEDISHYYAEEKEMVFYSSADELAEKIRYYLPRDAEREKIADAAYKRTIAEHIYEKRFKDVFARVLR